MYLLFICSLILIYIVAFIVAGVYITIVSANIKGIDGYDDSDSMQSAYEYSTIGAIVTWVILGLAILIGGAILIFFGPEIFAAGETASEASIATGGSHKFVRIALLIVIGIMMLLNIGVGILAVLTAIDLNDAIGANPDNSDLDSLSDLYSDAIIASVLTIGSVGLLILVFILKYFYHYQKNKKYQEKVAKVAAERHNQKIREEQARRK